MYLKPSQLRCGKRSSTQRKLVVAVRELNQETPAQYNARYIKERQRAAEQNIHEDDFIKALAERFDAKVGCAGVGRTENRRINALLEAREIHGLYSIYKISAEVT